MLCATAGGLMSRSSPEAPRGSPSHRVLHAVHQKHPAKRFQEDLQSSPRDFGKLSIDALRMPSSSFCSSNVSMEELASMDVAHIILKHGASSSCSQVLHAFFPCRAFGAPHVAPQPSFGASTPPIMSRPKQPIIIICPAGQQGRNIL